METPGKRTPKFPDGSFMLENEFNKAVAFLLQEHLKRCGFDTILVAPTDKDISLKQRIDLANSKKADFYISIHANAFNGKWGNANGIETYHHPNSVESKKAAKLIHAYLMQGTTMRDRGVKSANFYVLRETKMPAVLVECGFMDNLREAKLLMSDAYRAECAEEIAKGICKYFNVEYIEEQNIKQILVIENSIDLKYNNQSLNIDNFIYKDTTYVPLRFLIELFRKKVNWDNETKTINILD